MIGITQILQKAEEAPTKREKIKVLQENYTPALKAVLAYALDPDIKFLLPEGAPPYRPNELPDNQNQLYQEARRFYLFVEGGHPTLAQKKREDLFVMMLENLGKEDALLLLAIKDKSLPYKTLTPGLVQAAFPDIFKKKS